MKFKDLQPGDYIWILDLEDETLIETHPYRYQVTKGLHTSEFGYLAIRYSVPEWKGDYELKITDPESSLELQDPFSIGAITKEEIQEVFNNPERYGFELNI